MPVGVAPDAVCIADVSGITVVEDGETDVHRSVVGAELYLTEPIDHIFRWGVLYL